MLGWVVVNAIWFLFVLQAPSIDEKVDLHFIALVNVGGHLYELGKNIFLSALLLYKN